MLFIVLHLLQQETEEIMCNAVCCSNVVLFFILILTFAPSNNALYGNTCFMNVVKIDMLGRLYLCCSTFTVVLILGCLADLPFMMVGDWGGQADAPYYTDAQLNVAQQMGVVASSIGAQFVVSLGDHFYDNGVNNVSDPRFNETFEVRNKSKVWINAGPSDHSLLSTNHRTYSLHHHYKSVGTQCVVTTTTLVTALLKLPTPIFPRDGKCQISTTQRFIDTHI